MRSSTWHMRHGSWWALQWISPFASWFSLGIHIDLAKRQTPTFHYGPYADFHLGWCILSLGVNPIYSGEFEASVSISRGGIRV